MAKGDKNTRDRAVGGEDRLAVRLVKGILQCGREGIEPNMDLSLEGNSLKVVRMRLHHLRKAVEAAQSKMGQMNGCGDGGEWTTLFWTDRQRALKQLQEAEEPCPISKAIPCDFYGIEYDNKYRTDCSQVNTDGGDKEILPPFPEEDFEELLQTRMSENKAKSRVPFTREQRAEYRVKKWIVESGVSACCGTSPQVFPCHEENDQIPLCQKIS
eukprot:gene7473-8898_t